MKTFRGGVYLRPLFYQIALVYICINTLLHLYLCTLAAPRRQDGARKKLYMEISIKDLIARLDNIREKKTIDERDEIAIAIAEDLIDQMSDDLIKYKKKEK